MKAVRLEECSTTCTITEEPAEVGCATTKSEDTSSDLRASRDFCSELRTRCTQDPAATRCVGHIDVHSDDLRHSFYGPQSLSRVWPSAMTTGDLVPIDAFLHSADGGLFSTTDKLKMARSLVLAVLKLYATPWLPDAWRLQDVSLFHQEDVSQALRTVHLGVEFQGTSTMEDIQLGAAPLAEEEQVFRGIDNMTLHSLGAALLQSDTLTRVDPGDVVRVRKMAKLGSSLGPRYSEITQKCLRCDFGFGTDLGKAALQKAIYGELIGALEGMISRLSKKDDEW